MRAVNALKLAVAATAIAGGIALGAGAAYAGGTPQGDSPAPAPSVSPTVVESTAPGGGPHNSPWD